ncbi:MAG: peptidylprolyl isomerase [Phototrophicales bacterium]|nr:peptidylprolyl isomerase [Phototrophicales bacterium]
MTKRDKTTGLPKPPKKPTETEAGKSPNTLKEYRSRAEREAEIQRMILIGTIIAIAITVLVLALAFVVDQIINPAQVVASVNGDNITVREFQEEVRIERVVDNQQILNDITFYVDSGFFIDENEALNFLYQNDPNIRELVDGFSANDQYGLRVLNTLVENRIVQREAEARGVTITDADVDEQVRRLFRFTPPEETDPEATPEPEVTATITPTPFVSPTPSNTPQPTVEAFATATATLQFTPAPTITALPTLTASEQTAAFNDDVEAFYTRMSRDAGVSRERVRQYFETLALREAVARDMFGEKTTLVWANTRHIIVDSEEKARDIYEALLNGESFATLAASLGTDGTAQRGGELGWLNTEQGIDVTFGEKARTLPIGEISEPFQTDFGWHVMQVRDRENREATTDEIDATLQTAFTEWLTTTRENTDYETSDFWIDFVPSDPPLRLVSE